MTGPASLGAILRRAHLTLALSAVAIAGIVLAIPAVVTLQMHAEHDLALVSRAIGHTVEAAVVFGDAEAAQEALASIVAGEDVAEARITARDGRELARWTQDAPGWAARLGLLAGRVLHQTPAALPVLHDGAVVGQVIVQGGGRTMLRFVLFVILGIAGCQAIIAVGAAYLSGRIVTRIMRPLQALTEVTGTVQRERAFSRRVPGAGIAELDELGHSFNGLLSELDAWQSSMEGENRRLSHQASHDSLTGLPNRSFFEGRLNRALSDAGSAGNRVGVLLIDCDRFKEINDGHGHAAGDAVLVAVAARLKGALREHDLVARIGGDEFAVMLAPVHDPADVQAVAATVGASMRAPVLVRDGVAIVASISVGAAVFPDEAATIAALLHQADAVMYRAKRAARAEAPGGA